MFNIHTIKKEDWLDELITEAVILGIIQEPKNTLGYLATKARVDYLFRDYVTKKYKLPEDADLEPYQTVENFKETLQADEEERIKIKDAALTEEALLRERWGIITTTAPKPETAPTTEAPENDTSKQIAEKYFYPFSGYKKPGRQEKIMSDKEYTRLIGYISSLIKNVVMPTESDIKPVRADVPQMFIMHTFYLLHQETKTNKYILCRFIKGVFKDQFENVKATTIQKKWATFPPYNQDKEMFIANMT